MVLSQLILFFSCQEHVVLFANSLVSNPQRRTGVFVPWVPLIQTPLVWIPLSIRVTIQTCSKVWPESVYFHIIMHLKSNPFILMEHARRNIETSLASF